MTSRILPVVIILIALGLFFGYVHPTYTGSVAELRTEIRSYDSALEAADAYREREAELLAEKNAIPAEGLARIEAFLPDGVDNVQLILDLNALADRTDMLLSDFDITEVDQDFDETNPERIPLASDGLVEAIELSVSGVGSYESFKTFLDGVEWSLRPLDLVELNISQSDTGIYNYDMHFRIYWLATP